VNKLINAGIIAVALTLSSGIATASDSKGSHAGHETMKAVPENKSAVVSGVINSVDAAAGKINVTHEKVPELGWPKMTMDLPVTRRVDLSKIKTGSTVDLTLKQGLDKQFRVIGIEQPK